MLTKADPVFGGLVNPHIASLWNVSNPPVLKPSLSRGALTIRSATLEDVRSLADVLTVSFHHYGGMLAWVMPMLRLGVYEDLHQRLKLSKEHHACFVACLQMASDVVVVGTVEISVRYVNSLAIAPMKVPYISNLAVNPEYRRLGIASKLLTRCETQVKYWRYDSLALHVLEDNEAARQLYLTCGYDVQQTEHPFRAWILRRPRRLFLQKDLSP